MRARKLNDKTVKFFFCVLCVFVRTFEGNSAVLSMIPMFLLKSAHFCFQILNKMEIGQKITINPLKSEALRKSH